jgi:hypothetical protein
MKADNRQSVPESNKASTYIYTTAFFFTFLVGKGEFYSHYGRGNLRS